MNRTLAALTFATLLAPSLSQAAPAAAKITDEQYASVLAGPWRAPENSVRDGYRHPEQTLKFFGLQHNQTVIEITPGGGWYSEILAPLLKDHGHYIAALQAPASGDYYKKSADGLKQKFKADPTHYAKAGFVEFDPKAPAFGKPGSADRVLTFRNVHNLMMQGEPVAAKAFADFHKALKPGGILGVVDHRLPESMDSALEKQSGYIKKSTIVRLATAAGFKLVGESEVNANPKDSHNWPDGVWTLPPTYKLGDVDRAKYQAIGESDRLTLKFVKP